MQRRDTSAALNCHIEKIAWMWKVLAKENVVRTLVPWQRRTEGLQWGIWSDWLGKHK